MLEPIQIVIALVQGILLVLLAPLVSGIARKFRAKMHTRRGPSVFQDYYDIAKLLKRQDVHSNHSSNISRILPPLYIGTMFVLAMGLPMATRVSPIPALADAILIVYLLALPRFFFGLAGLDSGSAYAGTGSVRELLIGTLVEPSLMLALFVAALACGTTNIAEMGVAVGAGSIASPIAFVVAGVAFAVDCYIEMGKLPYDLAEAEQELQEGPLAEMSGPALAMMHIAMPMKQAIMATLLIAIFLPFGSSVDFSFAGVALGTVVYVLKMLVILLITMVLENVVSRVRWNITGRQTWFVVAVTVCAFAFCVLGI
ncbi:respiratory chain complex I subunit 1 family protein [Denitrobacterium detoxificans]|uniref:Hydrogenase-4 component C n=1 Tax=Denitrobacterium detoxificans TaxID=79604 RepID=A0A1H8PRD9_9ACTN|nr:NADH-quinone oxidoreductase subunit H [Denitrobacterium detoxificans]SEO44103.1 hydrogenase-4 component C [Denitrobacterium detoxificans]